MNLQPRTRLKLEEIQDLLQRLKDNRKALEKEESRILWLLCAYVPKTKLAKMLGIDRKTLYNKLNKTKIKKDAKKAPGTPLNG